MRLNFWDWTFIVGFLGALINLTVANLIIGVLRSGFGLVILTLFALGGYWND